MVWRSIDAFVAANEENLIEYISPVAKDIPDKFKDPNGIWTGIYVGYLGFVGNKEVLKEIGLRCLNLGLTF